MVRFQFKHRAHNGSGQGLAASAAVFILLMLLFLSSFGGLSSGHAARESALLEKAISRAITACYSAEGRYPDSLAYLKDNYGLFYNEDRFYVDYIVIGSNVRPDVTVITLEDRP